MTLLVAWLWQGLLVAAGTWLMLRLAPRLNAATRHVIWWGALAGVIFLGVVHLASAISAPGPMAVRLAGPDVEPQAAFVSLPAAPDWLLTLALAAWAAAAVRGWLRVLRGVRQVSWLRREAIPLGRDRTARFARWTTGRWRRPAPVYVTQAPVGACAIGFRRPAILVSRQLLDTLDDDGLDQVVLHEQAHLDRYDDWMRALQSLVTSAAAIHPAVHVIARHIDLEREAACDDRVVTATGGAGEYAACLAEAAGAIAPPAVVPAVSALGGGSSRGSLRARVARLLDPRPDRGRRVVRPVVAAAVASIGALLVAAPLMPSLVVFVEQAAPPTNAGLELARPAVAAASARTARGHDVPALQSAAAFEPVPIGAPRSRAATEVRLVAASTVPAEPPAVSAVPAQEPAAPPPVADPLEAGAHEFPHETLGAWTLLVADAPPLQQAAVPATARSLSGPPESSFLGDMSSLGKVTATTAWKAGLSVAGTFARAGKAIGKLF